MCAGRADGHVPLLDPRHSLQRLPGACWLNKATAATEIETRVLDRSGLETLFLSYVY